VPSPVWPLPIYLFSWTWHSRFLCNIVLYSVRLYFHHQSHSQLGIVFTLLSLFILSGAVSPVFSSSILGTYRPGEFIFQCPIFLPFHTVHGVSSHEYWSGLPFPSPVDHILSELSPMTHPSWVALQGMAHSFIELDKAVMQVIILVQFSSVAQLCLTLCDPMNCSTPGLPVHHQLLEFTQIHVHRVGDAIQPSYPLSSPSPPAPNPSQHQGLFQWVNPLHKVLQFQLQHQSFQWTPRTDLL